MYVIINSNQKGMIDMLKYLNEMISFVKGDMMKGEQLKKVDRIDSEFRNINPNGLDSTSMIAYNELNNVLYEYYSQEQYFVVYRIVLY